MKIYSRVSSHEVRYVTLERCGLPRRSPECHKGSPSSPSPLTKIRTLFLWLAFPPLRRWQARQSLHKLHEGEARASSQSSTKRSPQHQPPSQLGGHPPRVTSSRSLTRTNRNGELSTMQGCKARTPKVLKSVTLKSHQSNKC